MLFMFVLYFHGSNYNLTSMINKPTCYKNSDKPTYIDLILTNCPGSFRDFCVINFQIFVR